MKILKNKLTTAIALGAALILSAQQASASPYDMLTLSFDNSSGQIEGSVNYGTENGPLVGSGIEYDLINAELKDTQSNTTQQLSPYTIEFGSLGFKTGDYIPGSSSVDTTGDNNSTWVFGSDSYTKNTTTGFPEVDVPEGTSFTLRGTIWDGTTKVFSGTILSGHFVGFQELDLNSQPTGNIINPSVSGSGGSYTFSGGGITEIAPELLASYGLESDFNTFATTVLKLDIQTINNNGTFSGNVVGGSEADIVTTSLTLEISNSPVNSSGTTISMLGIGLFCLGFVRRAFSSK